MVDTLTHMDTLTDLFGMVTIGVLTGIVLFGISDLVGVTDTTVGDTLTIAGADTTTLTTTIITTEIITEVTDTRTVMLTIEEDEVEIMDMPVEVLVQEVE